MRGLHFLHEPRYTYIGHLLSIGDDVGAKFTEWQEQVGMCESEIGDARRLVTHMYLSHVSYAGPVMQVRLGVVKWIVVSGKLYFITR